MGQSPVYRNFTRKPRIKYSYRRVLNVSGAIIWPKIFETQNSFSIYPFPTPLRPKTLTYPIPSGNTRPWRQYNSTCLYLVLAHKEKYNFFHPLALFGVLIDFLSFTHYSDMKRIIHVVTATICCCRFFQQFCISFQTYYVLLQFVCLTLGGLFPQPHQCQSTSVMVVLSVLKREGKIWQIWRWSTYRVNTS